MNGVGVMGVIGVGVIGVVGVMKVGDGGGIVLPPLDAGYWHDPELGSVVVMVAVPPKSQLVGRGFFW